MKESEVETIVQRAREQFPGERPRIISDNGPQFVTKDLKEYTLTSTPTDISCRVGLSSQSPHFSPVFARRQVGLDAFSPI